jgi:hypothetical protein
MQFTFCAALIYAHFVTICIANHLSVCWEIVTFQNMYFHRRKWSSYARPQISKYDRIKSQADAKQLWEIVSKHLSITSTEKPKVKRFYSYKADTFQPGLLNCCFEPRPEFKYEIKLTCFGITVHLSVYLYLVEDVVGNVDDDNYGDVDLIVRDTLDETKLLFSIADRDGETEKKYDLLKSNGCAMCKEIIDMIGIKDIFDKNDLFVELESNLLFSLQSDRECDDCIYEIYE